MDTHFSIFQTGEQQLTLVIEECSQKTIEECPQKLIGVLVENWFEVVLLNTVQKRE